MSCRLALFTLFVAGVLAAQLRPLPGTEEARQAFLSRFAAAALDRTQHAVRYDPAYVRLPYPGLTHIGMVVDRKAMFARRYMVVHNIGQGPKMEDVLFDWKITGYYLYFGPERGVLQRPPNARRPSQPAGQFSL